MAANTPKFSYEQEMKELVAEQPGLFVSALGIVIALFFGLAVRALVAPEKVKEKIIQASSKVHSEMQFEVGEAFVSFSNGVMPELAVVIREVKMTSEKQCWMRPQAEIDEIKLPISFLRLIQGQIFVHEVLANEAIVSLRSEPMPCANSDQATVLKPNPENITRNVAQALSQVTEQGSQGKPQRNTIDTVRIRKLMVSYLPVAFTTFELDNLSVKAREKDLEFSSLLKLGGGTLTGDYSSQAQLKISHLPSKGSNNWKAELKGLLREGHYDFLADYNPDTKKIDLNTDVKHLPLNQIFPILQKYKVFTAELNGKRVWLSMKAKSSFEVSQSKTAAVLISGFRVEGDLGDILAPEIIVESLQPFKMKPLAFDLQGLDLNHFLVFLNRPHPTPALGNLGIFNGKAYYQDRDNIRIAGEHSGLQFIFSNKGIRETQTLSLVAGELTLKSDKWTVLVDSLKPLQGLFEGQLKLQASKDWRDIDLAANISELILAPTVQKIMTNGGDVGPVTGKIDLQVREGDLSAMNGSLDVERMLVESIEMKKAKFKISGQSHKYNVDASASAMEIPAGVSSARYVFQILPEQYQGKSLSLKLAKIKIKTERLRNLQWSDFTTFVSADSKSTQVSSQGGWDFDGKIAGKIKVRESSKDTQWLISGTRDKPELVKTKP